MADVAVRLSSGLRHDSVRIVLPSDRAPRRRSATNGVGRDDCGHGTARCGWCFPPLVRQFAERLMSQQLWCWGRDIEAAKGNLLLRRGFERQREPGKGRDGSTCYRFDDGAQHVALWGFGMFFGEREFGGLYVGRYDFRPRWARVEALAAGVHRPQDLKMFARPSSRIEWLFAHRLCRSMLGWIARYEDWIQQEAGAAFRARCIQRWLHPWVSGDDMAKSWRLLEQRAWDRGRSGWQQQFRQLVLPQKKESP